MEFPTKKSNTLSETRTHQQSGYKKRKEKWADLLLTGFCLAEACKNTL